MTTVRANPTTRSALRFLLVGASNNLAMYGLFVLLTLAGVAAIPAATITYALGMVISFVAHRRYTFGHRGDRGPAIARFVLANVAGYALNVALLHALVSQLGWQAIPAQVLAVAVVAAALFVAMKLWVFRDPPRRPGAAQPLR